MHRIINYTKLNLSDEEKQRKACMDTLHYLGQFRFKIMANMIKYKTVNDAAIEFYFSFAGVEGYPVEAMVNRYSQTKGELK
jgi:hypothetical protein